MIPSRVAASAHWACERPSRVRISLRTEAYSVIGHDDAIAEVIGEIGDDDRVGERRVRRDVGRTALIDRDVDDAVRSGRKSDGERKRARREKTSHR